jgi:hypothetical protein
MEQDMPGIDRTARTIAENVHTAIHGKPCSAPPLQDRPTGGSRRCSWPEPAGIRAARTGKRRGNQSNAPSQLRERRRRAAPSRANHRPWAKTTRSGFRAMSSDAACAAARRRSLITKRR